MANELRRTDRDVLRDCLTRWTEVLSLFERSDPARHRLNTDAYAVLRDELIAACRLCAVRARLLGGPADPEGAFYAGLEEIIKPWLDLHVVDRTDREILASVLEHCRQVEGQLEGTTWKPAASSRRLPPAAIVVGGTVIFALICLVVMTLDLSSLSALRDATDTLWLKIKLAESWLQWSAVAVVLALALIFVVSQSTKTRA
jgi:hypothetical protein